MLRTHVLSFGRFVGRVAARLTSTHRRRIALLTASSLAFVFVVLPAAWLVHHVYFDRSGVPDLEPFLRF